MRKIALYFLLFVASGWSAEGAEICLRQEAVCSGPVVRLADVAEFAADDHQLAGLALFPAPATGKPRLVRRHEIEELLQLSGVSIRDFRLTGADAVTIHSGRDVTEKTIRRPAYQFVPAAANVVREAPVKPANSPPPAPAKAASDKLVARGQSVTIRAIAPGVRITSPGRALADGGLGDDVMVELADSRQQVQARVAGPQVVEIRTGAGQ